MPIELIPDRQSRAPIVPALALALLILVAGMPIALADAAAGSAAFEKGDYVRAMAEWASAAERGDADAEFGLGMLYERGDGAVKQSYKEADRWYQKAAEHDHIGAQYRLALIWSAGSEEFPSDPAEAYKWILLASERGLATDVKAQLENIIDRPQQTEGKKRATKWKEERAAAKKKLEPPPAATAPAAAPGAAPPPMPPPRSMPAPTATAGRSGGCPGWPFPTLPCTEQFPALPGVAPTRAPTALPPPRSATPN
ncbi:MAG: tetratricopeptide repeat protein [Alphaproteobacteria bacterium]